MTKVFIDGQAGTTGLQISERLAQRPDIQVLAIADNARKDRDARAAMFDACDVAILCLPDAAAMEAVALAGNRCRCTGYRAIETAVVTAASRTRTGVER